MMKTNYFGGCVLEEHHTANVVIRIILLCPKGTYLSKRRIFPINFRVFPACFIYSCNHIRHTSVDMLDYSINIKVTADKQCIQCNGNIETLLNNILMETVFICRSLHFLQGCFQTLIEAIDNNNQPEILDQDDKYFCDR